MYTRLMIGLLVLALLLPLSTVSAQENIPPAGCTIELETLILELVQAQRAADAGNTFQAVQLLDTIQAQIADLVATCEGVTLPLPLSHTALDGSVAFNYPADWHLVGLDPGVYLLASSSTLAEKIRDEGFRGLQTGQQGLILAVMRLGEEIDQSATYETYVQRFVSDELNSISPKVQGPEPLEIAGHPAQRFTITDETMAAIFDLADFTTAEQPAILVIAGIAAPGELAALSPILDAFEQHLRYPAEQSLRLPGAPLDTLSYAEAISIADLGDGLPPTTALAPDGSALAWFNTDGADAICHLTLDDRQPTCDPVPEQWHTRAFQLHWSPDSTYIAWTDDYYRYFREPDILLYEVGTGQFTNATDDGIEDWNPMGGSDETGPVWVDTVLTWGPDGYLYFMRGALASAQDEREQMRTLLTRLDPASGQTETVRDLTAYFDSYVIYPAYEYGLHGAMALSPDASQIAVLVRDAKIDDPANGVYVIDLADDTPPVHVATMQQLQTGYPEMDNGPQPVIPHSLAWTASGDGLIVWSNITDRALMPGVVHHIDLTSQHMTPLIDFSGLTQQELFSDSDASGRPLIAHIPRAVVLAPDGDGVLLLHLWPEHYGLSALTWDENPAQAEQVWLFETDDLHVYRGRDMVPSAARDGTLLLKGILFLPAD